MTCSVRGRSRRCAFRPVVIGLMAFFMSILPLSVIAQPLIAFGDSTTAPRSGVPTYADILRGELLLDGGPLEVMNAGVPGNTTAKAIQRFQADVISKAPHTVVILFGINDAAVDVWKTPPATGPRVPLSEYKANLVKMVRGIKDAGGRVVLMTPTPLAWSDTTRKLYGKAPYDASDDGGFNVLLRGYAQAVRDVAREEGVLSVDLFDVFSRSVMKRHPAGAKALETDLVLCPDGMHPGEEGQRLMAEAVMEALIRAEARYTRKPGTEWTSMSPINRIAPQVVDVSHDTLGPAVLGPALVQRADGSVLSVFSTPTSYGGRAGECFIAGRVTRDGGKSWEALRELTRLPEGRAAHPTIHRGRDGTLHLFFLGYVRFRWDKASGNPGEDCRSDLWTARSVDEGASWSMPQRIFEGYTGSTNGVAETEDGRLIVPFSHYVRDPGRLVSRTVSTDDGGVSWRLSEVIDIGGAGDHDGALEPCVLRLSDGRIWMLIRTTLGVFWESFSSDGGRTWSAARATSIPSTSAPAHVVRVADGRMLMAWNPREGGRKVLQVAHSADEGRTWSAPVVIVRGSATYPFLMEARSGDVWLGFIDAHAGWGTSPRAHHVRIPSMVLGL